LLSKNLYDRIQEQVALLILKGVIFIEDKLFELLTEMYSKMTEQFEEINRKLDT
jgi:hypothetical protein